MRGLKCTSSSFLGVFHLSRLMNLRDIYANPHAVASRRQGFGKLPRLNLTRLAPSTAPRGGRTPAQSCRVSRIESLSRSLRRRPLRPPPVGSALLQPKSATTPPVHTAWLVQRCVQPLLFKAGEEQCWNNLFLLSKTFPCARFLLFPYIYFIILFFIY